MADRESGGTALANGASIGNTDVRAATKSRDSKLPDQQRRSTAETAGMDLLPPAWPSGVHVPVSRPRTKVLLQGENYGAFRRTCDRLAAELRRVDDYLKDGVLCDEGMEVVVEVEQILDDLYRVDYGQRECLKRIVVAINSQINNIRWTASHSGFLRDTALMLRNSYLVDDSLVKECYALIKRYGLDPFRGTVSESPVLKRYRIVEE